VRAQRIDTLLRAAVAAGPVELRELTRMQSDVALDRARTLIAIAIPLGEAGESLGPEGQEIAGLLRDWDGWAGAASTGAAVYHVFLERLTQRLLEHVLDEALLERYLALQSADADQIVFEILRDAASLDVGAGDWTGNMVRAAVRESLRETWFSLSYQLGANRSRWLWGRLHPLQFRAFLPGADVLRRGADLGPFAAAGSGASVNMAEYAPGEPYAVRVASTFRIAIDASELDEALLTIAPGQSGHPGHPHFADAIERWRDGRPMLLTTSPLLVEESSRGLLLLEPAP
jgi:penicillin amidase